jgi:hypothetical protein
MCFRSLLRDWLLLLLDKQLLGLLDALAEQVKVD